MTQEPERSEVLREELEGPDRAGHTTAVTGAGAGGHPKGDALDRARRDLDPEADEAPLDNDESIVGAAGTGGAGPGMIAPPPGTKWPDPMGGEDEERELERRTR
jgi:hypothetical protein